MKQVCTYPIREEADVDYQKLGYFVDEDGIEKVQVLLVATGSHHYLSRYVPNGWVTSRYCRD